jgi:hypothetical protein
MGLSNWPSLTDDDGSLTLGTEIDKAVFDAIKASIEADMYSSTNPTVTAENAIDEVVAARGSKASLDARLDVALNEDGTLKSQASLVTTSDAGSLPQTNTVVNETFLIWPSGDSSAPAGWTLAGTGAAVARAGTSLADTARKVGDFCAKLTYGSTTLTFYNDVITTAAMTRLSQVPGTSIGFGAWVKSAVASQCRVYVTDGVTTTYTSYHTGDGTWQWLSTTHDISASGTYLRIGISVESSAGNPAYLSGVTLVFSQIAPENWRPTPTLNSSVGFISLGGQSAGTSKGWYTFNRPAIVRYVQAFLHTAPTGATTFKIDVNKGGTSMLGSVLAFVASDKAAGKETDGTYQYRCFAGGNVASGTTITDDLTYDIDAVGSTIAGSDLGLYVRFTEYLDPFDPHKAA